VRDMPPVRCTPFGSDGGFSEVQSGDVLEVVCVLRPQAGVPDDGVSCDGDIDLTTPGIRHLSVEAAGGLGFAGTKNQRLVSGDDRLLSRQVGGAPRTAEPLVQRQGG
jgi:hypothetical protein